MTRIKTETQMLLKGTRTAMSFVAEARRLAISHPYPEAGQPGYSALADVLARAVLFANWEVVGAGALVRAGSVTRIVEIGLLPPYRSDEFLRRITWRLLADAAHDLTETPRIEDAYRQPMDITRFVARRRANRAADKAALPTPIGRIAIPAAPGATRRLNAVPGRAPAGMPRMPKGQWV
ncbi:hypothetical protein [Sinisalibacter aestuarii]|uniref:Uncharacterized protein n=1 Tax=Sinisalibacter aestuarii TaxID=2949426 RepID=A0ABQ5LQQ0_9RHOB|nr:hypothetical protein [Sinisalibacter aestuarii]GKY87249.1 hypothetical protein STA1M1_11180 [Sinisalibacter aestuarii]